MCRGRGIVPEGGGVLSDGGVRAQFRAAVDAGDVPLVEARDLLVLEGPREAHAVAERVELADTAGVLLERGGCDAAAARGSSLMQ